MRVIRPAKIYLCYIFLIFFLVQEVLFFCKLMVPVLAIDDVGVQILKGNKIWFIFESK